MYTRLKVLTGGESHGQALLCIMEGIPSNLPLSSDDINKDLSRRQKGYGRGGRMKIESDRVKILSGVRHGKTLGSPISMMIENRDWINWQEIMDPEQVSNKGTVTRPRPGHADLAGSLKFNHRDIRNVLERASARETASRVAAGAVAKRFLREFGIEVFSYVTSIGGIKCPVLSPESMADGKRLKKLSMSAEKSLLRCPDKAIEKEMIKVIDQAAEKGDSVGGIFEVIVTGVPAGLGSYTQWDKRLEVRIAGALMGIQAIKAVEIGDGFEMANKRGSEVMDEIYYAKNKRSLRAGGFYRKTNHAGGIEGGMSNGMPIIVRAGMKPIPTLRKPLQSVDIITKKRFSAAYERSDICAVPSASIIAEACIALIIADAMLEKFGGDSLEEVKRNFDGYLRQLEEF